MRLRTVIADDEMLSVRSLVRLLAPYEGEIEVIGIADNGRNAVEMIDRLRPDLVFVDVEMPLLDGFEVTRQMQHRPLIVFFTATHQYQELAERCGSLAYLCKPIGHDDIAQLMTRIRAAVKLPARLQFQPGKQD
jgi:two-component system, LytTR family, response regulator